MYTTDLFWLWVMGYGLFKIFLHTLVFYHPAPYLRHTKLPKKTFKFLFMKSQKTRGGNQMPPLACLGLGAPGRHRCFIFVGNPAYTIMFMIKS